jgi:hypothetical protein
MMSNKASFSIIILVLLVSLTTGCSADQKFYVASTPSPTNTSAPKSTSSPTSTLAQPTTTSTPTATLTIATKPDAQNVEIVGYIGKENASFSVPVSATNVFFPEGLAWKVAVAGEYAYVLQGADGPAGMFWGRLNVIDVSNPETLIQVGSYKPDWITTDIVVISHTAYLTDGQCEFGAAACWGGLHILDISQPSAPTQIGIYKLEDIHSENPIGLGRSWFASGVAVTNNLAYITGGPYGLPEGECGLRIVDVADAAKPKVIGKLQCKQDAGWSGQSIVVKDKYAYIAASDAGLRIVDVSNPSAPTEIGYLTGIGKVWAVSVEGHLVYMAADDAGLQVIDVSEPTVPRKVSSFKTPKRAVSLTVTNGYAYVAASYAGLRVIDVSDPLKLAEVGFYNRSGSVFGVTVANGYIYIADAEKGLFIAQSTLPPVTLAPDE